MEVFLVMRANQPGASRPLVILFYFGCDPVDTRGRLCPKKAISNRPTDMADRGRPMVCWAII
jgi:hypothetical protein